MALAVIGGSNFVGRYLIKTLSPSYSEIRLGDMYPFRQSVYRLQEDLGSNKIIKHPLSYSTNLRLALEGAEELIIVTHDYFKLAHSKHFYLEKAVEFGKQYGIKKITWVGPIELDHLSYLDGNPEIFVLESEKKARSLFPNLKSIRTNLLFGPNLTSLIIHKTLDDLSSGRKIITNNSGHSKFSPVHEDDFLNAFKSLKDGESAVIAGPEELKWDEIVNVLADHCGASKPSHTGLIDWLKPKIASNGYIGDIFYPSHYQQFYRLLAKTKELPSTVVGQKTLKDHFAIGKFQGVQNLNWHRVILD